MPIQPAAVELLPVGRIDAGRIRRTLSVLEKALAQSDLVSTFDGLGQ